jgi:hypothetical protein
LRHLLPELRASSNHLSTHTHTHTHTIVTGASFLMLSLSLSVVCSVTGWSLTVMSRASHGHVTCLKSARTPCARPHAPHINTASLRTPTHPARTSARIDVTTLHLLVKEVVLPLFVRCRLVIRSSCLTPIGITSVHHLCLFTPPPPTRRLPSWHRRCRELLRVECSSNDIQVVVLFQVFVILR